MMRLMVIRSFSILSDNINQIDNKSINSGVILSVQ